MVTQSEWLKLRDRLNDSEYRKIHTYEEIEAEEDRLGELYKEIIPEVGQMCTEILWTDRYAYTITEVITKDKIRIKQNDYTIEDCYDGEGKILPTLLDYTEKIITRRKNGCWYELGRPSKRGEVKYTLTHARTYRDPCF